jgi:hypothetical protein
MAKPYSSTPDTREGKSPNVSAINWVLFYLGIIILF